MEERLEVRDQGRDPVGVVHDDRRRSVAGHPRPGLVGVVVLPVLGVADDEEGPHQAVDVVRRRGQRLVDAADAQHLPEVGDQGPVGGRRRVHHQHRPQHVGMDGALEGVETRGGQGDRLLADEAAVVVERHALGAGRPDHAVGIVVAQGVGRADDELHGRARGGDREGVGSGDVDAGVEPGRSVVQMEDGGNQRQLTRRRHRLARRDPCASEGHGAEECGNHQQGEQAQPSPPSARCYDFSQFVSPPTSSELPPGVAAPAVTPGIRQIDRAGDGCTRHARTRGTRTEP